MDDILKRIPDPELFIRFVELDAVTCFSTAAWESTSSSALDVLVNNAGIAGDRAEPAQTTADHLRNVFETNRRLLRQQRQRAVAISRTVTFPTAIASR